MKTKLLLILVAIALMAGVGQANMLKNPSFEEGTFSEKNIPDSWSISWSSWTSAWTWLSDGGAHSGARHIKLQVYYTGSTAWRGQEVTGVIGNTDYAFSVSAKNPTTDGDAETWGYIDWLNSTGGRVLGEWMYEDHGISDDWDNIDLWAWRDGEWKPFFTAPSGAVAAVFYLIGYEENMINGINGIYYDDVYMGTPRPRNPYPAWEGLVYSGDVELSWTNIDPNYPTTSVYVDVLFGTEPSEMEPLALVPASGQDVTSVTVEDLAIGTYYWQVNSYIHGDPATTSYDTNPGDPNVIKGHLWSFATTDDLPPSVTVHTPAMIAWQNEPVQLDATVVDEGTSSMLIEWTASGTGVTFEPNEFVADPVVSIDKGGFINANIKNPSFEWGLAFWTGEGGTWGGTYGGTKYIKPSDGLLLAYTWDTGTEDNGLSQTLTETFTADTTYTLTVDVANDGYWEEDVQYRVQLRAGGSILAEDYDEHDLPVPGGLGVWKTSTVEYTCDGENDPNFVYIGEPLEIHLLAINDTWEMSFDNVNLTADPPFPAPPGSTYTLTITATDAVGSDSDMMEIDIYDDACQAARLGLSLAAENPSDIDANCNTTVGDLAELAAAWLNSTKLTTAEPDQFQPDDNPVVNGEFNVYKPGTDYTVTAEFTSDAFTEDALGDNMALTSGIAIYSDGTVGAVVDCPGWEWIHGFNLNLDTGVDGTVGLYAYADWGGDTRIQSAEPMGVIEAGKTYTVSAQVRGPLATQPLALDLMAGVSAPSPSSSVTYNAGGDWQEISNTYDANAVAGYIGEPITIIAGLRDEASGIAAVVFDNIVLDIVPSDPNLPSVNAGDDMIAWSGLEVQLTPTVVNNDPNEPQGTLTYAWSEDPGDGVVFSDPNTLAPTVTITKATLNPSPVKLTLAVTLEGVDTVSDTMTIDVYDDACKASRGNGHEYAVTDFDGNCVTSLGDFALLAEKWLADYTLTEPAPKP